MTIQTRAFGEVTIDDDKIITFPNGIIGFPDLQRFALLHDTDRGENAGIHWLQSLDDPGFAMPVMNPLIVKEDYNPTINDDVLIPLGELNDDNALILVAVTVPADLRKMSVNLCGPIVINSDTRKGRQIIVEEEDYSVKFPIYEILEEARKKAEAAGERK